MYHAINKKMKQIDFILKNINELMNKLNVFSIKNESYLFLMNLFAAAIVVEISSYQAHNLIPFLITFFLYVFCFLNPKNSFILILFFFISFFIGITKFPNLNNHSNLEFFISIGFFFLLISNKIFIKNYYSEKLDLSVLFRCFFGIVLFITGFHKLNEGFFDIKDSCVQSINTLHFKHFGIEYSIPTYFKLFFIYFTIFLELIIPFFLLFSSTRKIAFIVIALFSIFISFNLIKNFGSFIFFLLIASTIDLKQNLGKVFWQKLKIYQISVIVSSVLFFDILDKISIYFRSISCILFCIGMLYFYLFLLKNSKIYFSKDSYLKWNHKLIFAIIFILFWGLQGYIGLTNAGNLSMYSNLLTEKSRSNHLIVNTNHTKIFNFEEDKVFVKKVSPLLYRAIKQKNSSFKLKKYDLPMIELKKAVHQIQTQDKLFIEFEYNGKNYFISDVKNSPLNIIKWWHRFISLRAIPKGNLNDCQW